MKTAALFVLLLVAALATLAPAAPAPDEYSITVHVTSSYTLGGGGQGLDVVIHAKKYQLGGAPIKGPSILALGDYKAKLIKDEHPTAYESYQEYEFLFPDNKTKKFGVIGQSE
jgi:hypothetical protein